MKRKIELSEGAHRVYTSLDSMSRKGVDQTFRRLASGEDGYQVQRERDTRCIHADNVDPIRWGHGIRVIYALVSTIVKVLDIGDHRNSTRFGNRGVYNEEPRQKSRR